MKSELKCSYNIDNYRGHGTIYFKIKNDEILKYDEKNKRYQLLDKYFHGIPIYSYDSYSNLYNKEKQNFLISNIDKAINSFSSIYYKNEMKIKKSIYNKYIKYCKKEGITEEEIKSQDPFKERSVECTVNMYINLYIDNIIFKWPMTIRIGKIYLIGMVDVVYNYKNQSIKLSNMKLKSIWD